MHAGRFPAAACAHRALRHSRLLFIMPGLHLLGPEISQSRCPVWRDSLFGKEAYLEREAEFAGQAVSRWKYGMVWCQVWQGSDLVLKSQE